MNATELPAGLNGYIEHQDFEASHFGGPVWKIAAPGSAAVMNDIVRFLHSSDARLAYCRIAAGDRSLEQLLTSFGFELIEELVTLELELAGNVLTGPDGEVIRRGTPDDAPEVEELAKRCFRFDRYHTDPRIPASIADALKGAWARNDVCWRADTTFVSVDRARVTGFNCCMLADEIAVIDLIAVAPEYWRQGLGRRLLAASISHYAGRATRIRVGTQSSNLVSLKLYRAAGFRQVEVKRTFHWIPSASAA